MDQFYLKNQVGKFYTQGRAIFHPSSLQFFSPVYNGILKFDLEQNLNHCLDFTSKSNILFLCFSPKGEILIVADSSQYVYILNPQSLLILGQKRFQHPISKILFSQNGSLFFIVAGKFVYIYSTPEDIQTKMIESFQLLRKYNSSAYNEITQLVLGPGDTSLIYSGEDNLIRLVPVFPNEDFNETYDLKGHLGPILDIHQNLANKNSLTTIDSTGSLFKWTLVQDKTFDLYQFEKENKENLTEFEFKLKNSKFILEKKEKVFLKDNQITSARFHYDLLLVGFSNKSFILFSLNFESETFLEQLISFKISSSLITSFDFHERQNIIAFTSQTGQVSIWNWRSKTYLLQQESLHTEISEYAFSPDFSVIALGDQKGTIKVFDQESKLNLVTFKEFNRKITGLKFLKSNLLCASSLDGLVRIYDLNKRKMFRELSPESPNQLTCLDVEENGEIVFAGGFDPYCVYVWSFQTGKIIDVLQGH